MMYRPVVSGVEADKSLIWHVTPRLIILRVMASNSLPFRTVSRT